MAYKSNIPLATDKLSTSQSDLNGNFTEINTYVNVDHVAFNGANQGKHKKATFPVAAAPGAAGAAEVGIYAANSGGVPELFINKTATQIPFTASLKANAGWTYLPSGIIIQWTSGVMNGAASVVALPIAFPTAMFTVQVTPSTISGGDIRDDIIAATPNGLNAVFMSRSAAWSGVAIGVNILAIGY
jgi:hypothetical protein